MDTQPIKLPPATNNKSQNGAIKGLFRWLAPLFLGALVALLSFYLLRTLGY